MPTVNPRINVTLPPALDALVCRWAAFQRVSKSQVVRELLEASEPAISKTVALMEAAQAAQREHLGAFARSLESAQTDMESDSKRALARITQVTADLVSQAEAIKGRRPRRAPASVGVALAAPAKPKTGAKAQASGPKVVKNPPPSNRGVESSSVPHGGKKGRRQ
jgi:hypothetical protein